MNIADLIGNTPLVDLSALVNRPGVRLYGKLEGNNPAVTIVGCQPTDGAKIPGIRRWPEAYLPKIYEPARVDRVIDISQQDAEDTMRRLAVEAGVFVGVSAGGATWAALKVASELASGVVVCILCDRGDRYLSSGVFGANV